MSNLLERAIDCNDGEQAAKIIQDALGTMKVFVLKSLRDFLDRSFPADSDVNARGDRDCRTCGEFSTAMIANTFLSDIIGRTGQRFARGHPKGSRAFTRACRERSLSIASNSSAT
jgi:hypothetical protein